MKYFKNKHPDATVENINIEVRKIPGSSTE